MRDSNMLSRLTLWLFLAGGLFATGLAFGAGAEESAEANRDQDGDGVVDSEDLCPKIPGPKDSAFADGCPSSDADNDGVPDDYDLCPAEPETVNGFEDQDGCPDTAAAQLSTIAQKAYFETGKANLDSAGKTAVAEVAAFLNAHPEVAKVTIVGSADARGSESDNLALSVRRAETVRGALVTAGVGVGRCAIRGDGAQVGDTPEIQAANRRAEFVVTELAGSVRAAFDPATLAQFLGIWRAAAFVELHVRNDHTPSFVVVLAGAPAWLGPVGSRLRVYGARLVGNRVVLHCRGLNQSFSVVLVRSAAGIRLVLVGQNRQRLRLAAQFGCPNGFLRVSNGCAELSKMKTPAAMVVYAPTAFEMGHYDPHDSDALPPHQVTLTQPFALDRTEVTADAYRQT